MKSKTSLFSAILIVLGLLLIVGSFFYLYSGKVEQPKKLTLKKPDTLPPFFDLKSVKKKKNPGEFTLRIPSLELEEHVYEGVDPDTLTLGVGHYPGTAFPGEDGNIVLAGHSVATDTHPGPFTRIDELKEGDEVILIDKDGRQYSFSVTGSKVVSASELSVLNPTKEPTITFISCIKPDYPRDKRLITTAVQKA